MTTKRRSRNLPAVGSQAGVGAAFTVETERRSTDLIVSVLTGCANDSLVTRMRYQVMCELESAPGDWVLVMTQLEKIDVSIKEPLLDIMRDFRARGGHRVIIVCAHDVIRMHIASISISSSSSGIPRFVMVQTIDEAMAQLAVHVGEETG